MWPVETSGLAAEAATSAFHSSVVHVIVEYMRRVLPATFLVRSRHRLEPSRRASSNPRSGRLTTREPREPPLVSAVRFCVPCDVQGAPLQGEPMREVELWLSLAGWGRVHVSNVPVPYDRDFRCAFPPIRDAVLHRVPFGAAPPPSSQPSGRAAIAPVGEAHRHIISLELDNEHALLADVATRLLHTGATHR